MNKELVKTFFQANHLFKSLMTAELAGVDYVEEVLWELEKGIEATQQAAKASHKVNKVMNVKFIQDCVYDTVSYIYLMFCFVIQKKIWFICYSDIRYTFFFHYNEDMTLFFISSGLLFLWNYHIVHWKLCAVTWYLNLRDCISMCLVYLWHLQLMIDSLTFCLAVAQI